MAIPFDTIRLDIKEKRINRINQLFDYGTISEWKDATGFRKGVIESLLEDSKRFQFRHIFKIADNSGIKESTIRRLVQGQKSYNFIAKRLARKKDLPE
ncbi:MAG TPA: hypothetical protein VGN00_14375 [Puia sp.]|jgi:hypothetical protein